MKIVFLFYDGMTVLDAVGPHEILARLPGAEIYRVAKYPGKISTDSGLLLNAEYSLLDVSSADVLCLPGAGNAATLREFPDVHDWIRAVHSTTTWTTSVCTGSLILGRRRRRRERLWKIYGLGWWWVLRALDSLGGNRRKGSGYSLWLFQ